MLLIGTREFVLRQRSVKSEAMSPWRRGVLPAAVLVLAVAVSLAAGQRHHVRGQRQRAVSGSSRREVYRTTYTRESAGRVRADELVPEVVNINIERDEQTRT